MGISIYTAYVIHSNEVRIGHNKCEDGRYQGTVNLFKDDCFHYTIISSEKSQFETTDEAIKSMQAMVDEIRAYVDKELNENKS